jgi:hypothetical protein
VSDRFAVGSAVFFASWQAALSVIYRYNRLQGAMQEIHECEFAPAPLPRAPNRIKKSTYGFRDRLLAELLCGTDSLLA